MGVLRAFAKFYVLFWRDIICYLVFSSTFSTFSPPRFLRKVLANFFVCFDRLIPLEVTCKLLCSWFTFVMLNPKIPFFCLLMNCPRRLDLWGEWPHQLLGEGHNFFLIFWRFSSSFHCNWKTRYVSWWFFLLVSIVLWNWGFSEDYMTRVLIFVCNIFATYPEYNGEFAGKICSKHLYILVPGYYCSSDYLLRLRVINSYKAEVLTITMMDYCFF